MAPISLFVAALTPPVAAAPAQPATKPAASVAPASPPAKTAATKPPTSAPGVVLVSAAIPPTYTLDGTLKDWALEGGIDGVTIGVDAQRVVIAVTWAGPSRPNLALGLASVAPLLPDIGWSQRGGSTHELTRATCAVEQIPLIEAGWHDGRPHAPEVVKACTALLLRHAAKQAELRERFVRRIRVEGEAVTLLDANRKATPIAGAIARWGENTGEIELPIASLPALREAPLQLLYGGAAFGPTPAWMLAGPVEEGPGMPPELAKFPDWNLLPLAAPAKFGRYPDLLGTVFRDGVGGGLGNYFAVTWYTADKPETLVQILVDDVDVAPNPKTPDVPGAIGGPTAPDRPTVTQREEPLASTVAKLGDVEVVLSYGSVATLRSGKLVSTSTFSKPDATAKRGPDLHLFRYSEGGFNWISGYAPPSWSVVAVRPDGAIEEVADEGVDFPGRYDAWDATPQTFHSPDWSSFGMRGKRKGAPKTVTWRWNAAQRRYTVEAKPPQDGP